MAKASDSTAALYQRLVDRLRHALQYAEASRVMVEDALDLLQPNALEADLLAASGCEGRDENDG